MRGSVLLVGGDPGIGKSTLLIQAAAALARAGHRAFYISGEEAVAQVRLRAERGCCATPPSSLPLKLAVEDIVATSRRENSSPDRHRFRPDHVDRYCRIRAGHGDPGARLGAGPHPLRQKVRCRHRPRWPRHQGRTDRRPPCHRAYGRCGAAFEGEGSHQFRILRAGKNRFGPTDEIGVFERTGSGLREIANPSELFLSERDLGQPGTAVFAGTKARGRFSSKSRRWSRRPRSGRRDAPSSDGTQARCRWCLQCQAHCGVRLGGHDVYLNVAGGMRVREPAADLAAAAALVSSLANAPLPADAVYFGEVSRLARSGRWPRPPRDQGNGKTRFQPRHGDRGSPRRDGRAELDDW